MCGARAEGSAWAEHDTLTVSPAPAPVVVIESTDTGTKPHQTHRAARKKEWRRGENVRSFGLMARVEGGSGRSMRGKGDRGEERR